MIGMGSAHADVFLVLVAGLTAACFALPLVIAAPRWAALAVPTPAVWP